MSAKMKISTVSWIDSTEIDPKGIPSWNLSLVLHQLTKAPFEPLKEASLKHLIFETVFLLALGSGKHRCKICAGLHKNIRHQSDWSKVSLYLSPSFLSKNQMAKEGPDSMIPVVIPALAPTLDKALNGDQSLCPVRDLCYYLGYCFPLDQFLSACYWKFHNTFTQFYLKVVAWVDSELFHLGPDLATVTYFPYEVYSPLWD